MTSAEAGFVYLLTTCVIVGEECECSEGSFNMSDNEVTFNNCVVEDTLCSSSGNLTINGSMNDSEGGSFTYSGIISKKCIVSLDEEVSYCGFALSDLGEEYPEEDQICNALNL